MNNWLISLGLTRDSAVWWIGKWGALVVALASFGTDVTRYGIPAAWAPYLQFGALAVGIFSAQQGPSALPGAKKFALAFLVVMSAVSAAAQTPVSTRNLKPLAWDQDAPDLASAQRYQYQLTVDGTVTVTLQAPICTGALSPFLCWVPFPATKPGAHSLQLVAVDTAPDPDEASDPSNVLLVTVTITPTAPQNLRIGDVSPQAQPVRQN